jgi:hypothetical protein
VKVGKTTRRNQLPDAMVKFDNSFRDRGTQAWEMFIDLSTPGSGTGAPSVLDMAVPTGYTVMGIKLYSDSNPPGNGGPWDGNKQADIGTLAPGTDPSYASVFDGQLPPNYTFTSGNPGKLTVQAGATAAEYEYLVWIEDGTGNNSYADPGIRNKG